MLEGLQAWDSASGRVRDNVEFSPAQGKCPRADARRADVRTLIFRPPVCVVDRDRRERTEERDDLFALPDDDYLRLRGIHVSGREPLDVVSTGGTAACGSCGGIQQPRDSEIHHLHVAGPIEHHVLGFQISMDDALRVRFTERGADLPGDLHPLRTFTAPTRLRIERRLSPPTYSIERHATEPVRVNS